MRGLLDEGPPVRNGTVKLTKVLAERKIPAVQAILAARIDPPRPNQKSLLKTLAVSSGPSGCPKWSRRTAALPGCAALRWSGRDVWRHGDRGSLDVAQA
jgi:hypothetical protein